MGVAIQCVTHTVLKELALVRSLVADAYEETLLAELSRHGITMRAARATSPHSAMGCPSTFADERQRDPEFALAWDDAIDGARAEVEHELYPRAHEGVEEPVFGGKYKETVLGTVLR